MDLSFSRERTLDEARARRTAVLILVLLTLVVLLRAVSTARGAALETRAESSRVAALPADASQHPVRLEIEEPTTLLEGGTRATRTLVLRGLPATTTGVTLEWRMRRDGSTIARGAHPITSRGGGESRIVLTLPLPDVHRPAGIDLDVIVHDAGRPMGKASFPFTLYPAARARDLLALFSGARVALLDPIGAGARLLRGPGLSAGPYERAEDLKLFRGDLIVIGPGGFVRGREPLGPTLAARARAGVRVLLLDQPNLPGTLSEDLRLWPAFHHPPETEVFLDRGHPILRDIGPDAGFFALGGPLSRPLLPPTRGNFRVLAELRVPAGPAWQQGVAMLEMPLGEGTIVAAQAAIPALHDRDARARILLINTLAYLLENRPAAPSARLYAGSIDDLPACLLSLDPRLATAPDDLAGVDVLLAPADWTAPRRRDGSDLPRLSRVSRFLREGGTVVLVNPQSLVQDYLRRLTGAPVQFRAAGNPPVRIDGDVPLLRGVAPADLELLARPGRTELRLLAPSGADRIRPTLVMPGVAMYRVGRGTLVALALPDADECRRSRTASLLARLFTNLGVPLRQRPGIDPDAVAMLND